MKNKLSHPFITLKLLECTCLWCMYYIVLVGKILWTFQMTAILMWHILSILYLYITYSTITNSYRYYFNKTLYHWLAFHLSFIKPYICPLIYVFCMLFVTCFSFALTRSFLLFMYFTVLANVFWEVFSVQAVPFGETQFSKIAHFLYHHPTATDPFLMINQASLKIFNNINFVSSFCVLRISCYRGAKKITDIHKQVKLVDRKRKLLNFCIMAVDRVS